MTNPKPKKLNTYQKAKKVSYDLGYAKGVEDERRRIMEFNIKNTQKTKTLKTSKDRLPSSRACSERVDEVAMNRRLLTDKTSEIKLPTKLIITNYNKDKIKVTEEYDYKFDMWRVGVKLK